MDRTNKPEQFLVLTDAWGIIRKYLSADETMSEKVIHDFDELYQRFCSPFAKEVSIACLNEIDRIIKVNKEKCNGKEG